MTSTSYADRAPATTPDTSCHQGAATSYGGSAPSSPPAGVQRTSVTDRVAFGSLTRSAAEQSLGEPARHGVEPHALLGHRVALPDRDRLVVEGVEVDGDAERRADLVLAPVAPADRAGVVELDVPALPQGGREVFGLRRQVGVARKRQHGDLDRREPRVEPQHG